MRIASIQLAIRDDEAKEARLERTMGLLAACKGADLVLLPEIWNTGYFAFDRYQEEAEPLDGPTVQAAAEQARALGAWVHVGSTYTPWSLVCCVRDADQSACEAVRGAAFTEIAGPLWLLQARQSPRGVDVRDWPHRDQHVDGRGCGLCTKSRRVSHAKPLYRTSRPTRTGWFARRRSPSHRWSPAS